MIQLVLAPIPAGGTDLGDAGDPRPDTALAEAYRNMMRLAQTITDAAIRDGLLANIAAHREIAALWVARAPPGAQA